MSDKTWEEHWASGDTPWDAGQSAPSLHVVLKHLLGREPAVGRALVPGCGAGYDVLTLARAGYQAIGLDIAPSAQDRFATLRAQAGLNSDDAKLVVGDFFRVDAPRLGGTFDLVWDYTFYCAIDPAQRREWKICTHRLLKPRAKLGMLLFPVIPQAPPDRGPPYPLDPRQVEEELATHFRCLKLVAAEQSHPNREGKEWWALFEPLDAPR